MPVRKAARVFHVPEATIRGTLLRQVRGEPVDEDTLPTFGPERLFTEAEEITLVNHLSHMKCLGYEFYIRQINRMATNYAVSVGKKLPSDGVLSTQWYHSFHERWPEAGYQKPQKLATVRAKSTSKEVVDGYYSELKSVLDTHSLLEQPDSIYILDEITLPMGHHAESVYCGSGSPEGDTDDKERKMFSIIGCGNASGSLVPPYLILPGKRWNEKYLEGTCQGSGGECAEKGLCHALILKNYFHSHYTKFVPVGKQNRSTLVLYDGHKLHPALTLKSWAEKNNVIFLPLPPHVSFVTHLNMGCFASLKAVYTKECLAYLKQKRCLSLTNLDVGVVGSNAYLKAVTPFTLSQSFRKIGIYPYCKTITESVDVSDHTSRSVLDTVEAAEYKTSSPVEETVD